MARADKLSPLGTRPALDGVRAMAIVAVMGLHSIDRLFPGGFFGVDLFFVLSAFLITSLVLAETTARSGKYDFRAFYVRRALRLGPALILWLALVAAPTAIAAGDGSSIPTDTAVSLLYVGNLAMAFGDGLSTAYSHVWSLAVEEQFYLVWPAVLVLSARRFSSRAQMRTVYSAIPAAIVLQFASNEVLNNYWLPTGHIVPLTAGCAAAYSFAYGGRVLDAATRPSVAAGAAAVLIATVCGYRVLGPAAETLLATGVAASALVLVLHACRTDTSHITSVLSLPPVRWIGQRSYGLYLYHRSIAILVPLLVPGIALRIAGPLTAAISLLLAGLSFRYVEAPIRAAGRRRLAMARDRRGAASPETANALA